MSIHTMTDREYIIELHEYMHTTARDFLDMCRETFGNSCAGTFDWLCDRLKLKGFPKTMFFKWLCEAVVMAKNTDMERHGNGVLAFALDEDPAFCLVDALFPNYGGLLIRRLPKQDTGSKPRRMSYPAHMSELASLKAECCWAGPLFDLDSAKFSCTTDSGRERAARLRLFLKRRSFTIHIHGKHARSYDLPRTSVYYGSTRSVRSFYANFPGDFWMKAIDVPGLKEDTDGVYSTLKEEFWPHKHEELGGYGRLWAEIQNRLEEEGDMLAFYSGEEDEELRRYAYENTPAAMRRYSPNGCPVRAKED